MSTSKPQRLLRWSDLRALGYGRSATYEKIKAGKFPGPIPLYEGGRAVGFPEREIAKHESDDGVTASDSATSTEEYKVGPGRPPKEYQFKKGQSGNPKGRKPKKPSIELDLKLALEEALN